jgi:hypothetical protein
MQDWGTGLSPLIGGVAPGGRQAALCRRPTRVQTRRVTALEDRVDEFLLAPVGAAMFVLADRLGLGPDELAEPDTAMLLAASAQRDLNPWTSASAANRQRAVELAAPMRALAGAVLEDPRNAWWSASLGRRQLWLAGTGEPVRHPLDLSVPGGTPSTWEVYAQKPLDHFLTSTELPVPADSAGRSGAHAELCCGISDWAPEFPMQVTGLDVAPTARVYEIHSAADWHALVLRYADPSTHPGSDANLWSSAGIDNGMSPTWSAVARDYDGVHLSLAGLLTALYVPVADPSETTLWAWNWESTLWLRSAFTAVTPQPPFVEREDPGFWSPL